MRAGDWYAWIDETDSKVYIDKDQAENDEGFMVLGNFATVKAKLEFAKQICKKLNDNR